MHIGECSNVDGQKEACTGFVEYCTVKYEWRSFFACLPVDFFFILQEDRDTLGLFMSSRETRKANENRKRGHASKKKKRRRATSEK